MQKPLLKNEHELFFPLFDQIIQFAASDASLVMWNLSVPPGEEAKLIYHLIQFVPSANPGGMLTSPFQDGDWGGRPAGPREPGGHRGNSPKAWVSHPPATKRHGDTAWRHSTQLSVGGSLTLRVCSFPQLIVTTPAKGRPPALCP